MPIQSLLYRGRIFAGNTSLRSTLAVTQPSPLTLRVSTGSFTDTAGRTLTFAQTQDFTVVPDAEQVKVYQAELGRLNGTAEILARSRFLDSDYPAAPQGWEHVHPLVLEFPVPPGTTDLAGLNIYTVTVEPGFPPGTTAQDWRLQRGTI